MDNQSLAKRIRVSSGKQPADCVIKNGRIVNVFTGEIESGDIAIVDGYFAGIGNYDGIEVIDAKGKYIAPAFIDGHVHIESTMVRPEEFAKVQLMQGVTTVITDPHEIANVSGVKGIQYMLDATENIPFDAYFMLPSSVPATDFEQTGAVLNHDDLYPFYEHPRVLGLAEVMNYPAVLHAEPSMLSKLTDASMLEKKIDGHAAGLSGNDLNVYMGANIRTDHECTTLEEASERLRKGMYLMIREGTVAQDLVNIIGVVNERNSRRCLFVTDDRHLDDVLHEGSINHNVRLAIAAGIPELIAYQMATINAAECFGLKEHGAIAAGYKADFLILDKLETVAINAVYKNGRCIVKNGKITEFPTPELREDIPQELLETVCINQADEINFDIQVKSGIANIIEINPNSLVTNHLQEKVVINEQGVFQSNTETDQLKLALLERYTGSGQVGLAIVKGLGLKNGAIASTVAHDSHNLIVAGTNDKDMIAAIEVLRKTQGGFVIVKNGELVANLELPIAGLMCDLPYQEVYTKVEQLHKGLEQLDASKDFNPFLTLSFLALPVIPQLKITNQGLFDVQEFKHIAVDASR